MSLPGITVTHRTGTEAALELQRRGLQLRGFTRAPYVSDAEILPVLIGALNHYLDGGVTELQRLTTEAEG